MPYFITDKNADCSGWAVIDAADEVFGCHTTKESAIDQAIAISLADDEPFEGERAAVGSLNVGDWVSWYPLDPEILAEIVMVDGEYAVIRIYDEEDGVFEATDKMMVINIFKLERIPAPSMLAQKVEEPQHDMMDAPMDMAVDVIRNADGDPIIISDIDDTLLRSGTQRIDKVWEFIQSYDGALFLVTGRPESTRARTEAALADADISYSRLIMNDGSTADSAEYKKATVEKLLETYNVVLAVENDATTLGYYRELGIEAVDPADVPDSMDENARAINQEAPAYMRAAARRGLEYYADGKGGDGLVDRTISEARLMAEGKVSDDKWVRIAAWIARHMADLDSPDADPSSDNYPSAGVVAHLLWGSGATKRAAQRTLDYAQSVVDRIRAEEERQNMTEENRQRWMQVALRIKSQLEPQDEGRSATPTEVRDNTNLELRAVGDGMTFEGYAAIFDSDSEPLPFVETIKRGAFRKSLQARNDIKLLWNHDTGQVLGSTRAGTLKLMEDERGLKVTASLPDTNLGRDTAYLLKRGDVSAMSFGFNVIKDSWSQDGNRRTLESVRIHEVSLVSFPAYSATTGTTSVRAEIRSGIDADQLADALLRLETGEELDAEQGALITDVVSKLMKTPEVEAVDGDILALKKKKLDLLMKGVY